MANYKAVTQQAQNVAATPYTAYSGPLVAGINDQQTTGIGAVNSASGIQNGYNAASAGLTGAASNAIDPNTVNAQSINNYMSPYNTDVINATEAEIQNQNQQQAAALRGNSISSGAFGGDRAGVAQAQLAGQQDIANNATIANLNNQNYSQALNEANVQQTAGMTAQQETAANRLAAGNQFANLGNTAQTEALTEANAQTNAGTLQQTTQQAKDTAAYNQFLQQQAYPFQTTGWLANIVEGIGSQSGGTSTGQNTQTGSTGGSIVGGLLGLASLLPTSDRRLKENIRPVGKTFDGQTIYKYNFKGDHTDQIGLMAQDVEKKNPDAVLKDEHGIRHVDYGKATENAASRGHFDLGGRVKRAAGGGIASYQEPMDPLTGQSLGIGGGSYVPSSNLQIGHTMPTGNGSGGATAQPNGAATNGLSDLTGTMKGIQSLGNSFSNSGLGDAFNDFTQDNFGFASGGIVPRRRYEAGGVPALFDDYGNAVAPVADPLTQAAELTIPKEPVPTADQYVNQMPAPQAPPTPENALRLAMNGQSVQPTADTPSPYGGIATVNSNVVPTSQNDLGIAKLKAAMGPGNATASVADNPYGGLSYAQADFAPSSVPTPPVRPAGLGDTVPAGMTAIAPADATDEGITADSSVVPPQSAFVNHKIGSAPGYLSPGIIAPAIASNPSGDKWAQYNQLLANGDVQGALKLSEGLRTTPYWDVNHLRTGYGSDTVTHANGTSESVGPNTVITPAEAALDLQRRTGLAAQTAQSAVGDAWQTMTPGTKAALTSVVYNYGHLPQDIAAAGASGAPGAIAKAIANHAGDNDGVNSGRRMAEAAAVIGAPVSGSPDSSPSGLASTYAPVPPANIPANGQGAVTDNSGQPAGLASGASNGQSSGLFGLNLSPEVRQGMLAAGLGMMASTSRSPMVQIGQGGLEGIKQFQANRNLASEIGLRGAQTSEAMAAAQGKQLENQRIGMQVKMMMDHFNKGAKSGNDGSTSNAPAITTPTVTAPAVVNGSPTSSASGPQNAAATNGPRPLPDWDLATLTAQQNEALSQLQFGMPGAKETAEALAQRIAHIQAGGMVPMTDGQNHPYAEFAKAQADRAGAVAAAQKQAEVPASLAINAGNKNFDTQNEVRVKAATEADTGQHMLSQALAMRNLMFDPKTGQPTINSGPYGDHISSLAAVLKQAGFTDNIIKGLTGTDPSNAQELEKLRTSLGSESARADLAGSQVRVGEFQRYLASVPNATLLPKAYEYIIDKVIVPKAQQQINEYKAVENLDPSKDNIQGALFDYRQNHPWYTGAPPSDPADRVKDVIYSNPQGKRAKWTGTGWAPVQ